MNKINLVFCYACFLTIPSHLLTLSAFAQSKIYNPIPIQENQPITDKLTTNDIPTGEGGFARDYVINLQKGDQIAIDLTSDDFDTVVMLISEDGSTIAENDDSPDSESNSLLFTRIVETGKYFIRVKAFGATGNGNFILKLTHLKPIK
ncbi:PPC domain-containing protein [Geminocystis sp. GBBB08]|uniref:PPC domain-containing protein n=1 Tax=Geminocystis sp. GBBB08 TaxID=2604140 RepID=UPI0027E29E3D|nr:PPC domain-containing protein [Geminocystis sp. GBBB08]MBL1210554.1 peptidase [Geminocystis sp. GBBB08]